jgi:tetratricopeptide (TPR) repeat protein
MTEEWIVTPEDTERFQYRTPIAKGGMGTVWRAFDTKLDRWVALKSEHENHEPFTHASLDHPNIVKIFDTLEEGGKSLLVMQYVDGPNLGDLEGLTPGRLAKIIRDAARGVHFAHTENVIHRDLKPENILVGTDDHPYILDFGLAHSPILESQPGEISGTPSYMSPRQAKGGPPDVRDDVYSLGASLTSLLSAKAPMELRRIAGKATAKDERERYQSAQALADALDRFLNRRRKRLMAWIAAVVLMGLSGVLITGYVESRQRQRAEEALNLCREGERELFNNKDYPEAVRKFTEAIKTKPEARTYLYRGGAYMLMGNFEAALADCELALKLDPENEAALENCRIAKDVLGNPRHGSISTSR